MVIIGLPSQQGGLRPSARDSEERSLVKYLSECFVVLTVILVYWLAAHTHSELCS